MFASAPQNPEPSHLSDQPVSTCERGVNGQTHANETARHSILHSRNTHKQGPRARPRGCKSEACALKNTSICILCILRQS